MSFLFQLDRNNALSPDSNVIRDLVVSENEWLGRQEHKYLFASLEELPILVFSDKVVKDVVPVGSLEFCSAFAQRHLGLSGFRIPALNIPNSLLNTESGRFVQRDIAEAAQMPDALAFLKKHHQLIAKPADTAKRFEAQLVTSREDLSRLSAPLFLSEVLDGEREIVSEWRVFFLGNRLVDIRPYALRQWRMPDEAFVSDALSVLTSDSNCPPSGTLDVAVLKNGANVVLEVHPFVSCGLYGCESRELLLMNQRSWRWLVKLAV